MRFIILIASLAICIETIFYGIYEYKQLKNKYGGVSVIALSVFMFFFINIMVYLR